MYKIKKNERGKCVYIQSTSLTAINQNIMAMRHRRPRRYNILWNVADIDPVRIYETSFDEDTKYFEYMTSARQIITQDFGPNVWVSRAAIVHRMMHDREPKEMHHIYGAFTRIFQNRSDNAENETTEGFLMKKENKLMYFRINV